MNGIHLSHIFNHFFSKLFTKMKYWLSHLPLEVWVDVFCYSWISREELAELWTDLAIASLRNICNSIFMIGANTHCI